MFRGKYKHMIDQVHPSDELLCHVLKSAHSRDKKKNVLISSFRKPVTAIIALCICMSLAIPVLAATVEPIYQLMYMISPSIAQFFMPVQRSDEDNGIKMEVVSAYIHGNVAEIYITMQDLTGDRIDETTDLYDRRKRLIPRRLLGNEAFSCAPRMARNSTVRVRYGGWQSPTISQAQGCPS